MFSQLSLRQHKLAYTTSELVLQRKALEDLGCTFVHVWVCSYTNVEGSVLTQNPSNAKSIFHRMVAQELLRQKERTELVNVSKAIYHGPEEIFRDHENYLAKSFQINPTD